MELALTSRRATYTIIVSTSADEGEGGELLRITISFDPGLSSYSGEFSIRTGAGDVAPYMPGLPIPHFDANGQGRWQFRILEHEGMAAMNLKVRSQ